MIEWFYEENGQHRGPVKEEDLRVMFANGFLPPHTRVWTAAFVNEWKPASQTELVQRAAGSPPPLSPPFAGVPPFPAHGYSGTSAAAPAATGPAYEEPNDVYAWLLALSPLAFAVVEALLYNPLYPDNAAKLVPGIGFWVGLLLAWLDARNLIRSRRNPQQRAMVPFVMLTPVAYFWRRYAVVGTSLNFLWIWIGCFLAYAFALGALLEG